MSARSRRAEDPDERLLREPPPGFKDPDDVLQEDEGDDTDEAPTPRGQPLPERSTADETCAVCGLPTVLSDPGILTICAAHLPIDRGNPRTGPGCGHEECVDLEDGIPFACELPYCGRRAWCFDDVTGVHAGCVPRCAEPGCLEPPSGRSPRCVMHSKLHVRELTRIRVDRFRAARPEHRRRTGGP